MKKRKPTSSARRTGKLSISTLPFDKPELAIRLAQQLFDDGELSPERLHVITRSVMDIEALIERLRALGICANRDGPPGM